MGTLLTEAKRDALNDRCLLGKYDRTGRLRSTTVSMGPRVFRVSALPTSRSTDGPPPPLRCSAIASSMNLH